MMSVTRRNTDLRHASCFALAVFCGQCAQAARIDRKKPRVQSLKRARDLCSLLCFSAHAASSRRNLVELLVNLRDMAAIVTVGRYHHDVPFCEGQGHHLALAATAPSVRTPVDASQLGPEPLSDRSLRAPRGRWALAAAFLICLDALKLPCRSCSLLASWSACPLLPRCRRRCSGGALRGSGSGV